MNLATDLIWFLTCYDVYKMSRRPNSNSDTTLHKKFTILSISVEKFRFYFLISDICNFNYMGRKFIYFPNLIASKQFFCIPQPLEILSLQLFRYATLHFPLFTLDLNCVCLNRGRVLDKTNVSVWWWLKAHWVYMNYHPRYVLLNGGVAV